MPFEISTLRVFGVAGLVLAVALAATADRSAAQTAPATEQPAATGAQKDQPAETPKEKKEWKLPPPFTAKGTPQIPNYWDPNNRPEKSSARIPTIRFLTSSGFPPFNFVSADGRLTGFNVEIAREACLVLEAECTIQMRPFAELVTALEEKRGDAIIAGIAMTAKTREKLEFSDVFLRLPARFAAARDTTLDPSPAGLSGKWIAAVAGTAHEAFLHAFFRDARIITYPTPKIGRAALKAGDVDAYFGSGMSLSFWLTGEDAAGCCEFLGGPYTDPNYFGAGLSIAVARENVDLKKALDYALHRIHESGRYGELYLRYFPVSFY